MKEIWIEKLKKSKAFSPQCSKQPKSSEKKFWREKKKLCHQVHACKNSNPTTKDFLLAIGDNITTLFCEKTRKDISYIICFNCDKKKNYADKYPKYKKESKSSNN